MLDAFIGGVSYWAVGYALAYGDSNENPFCGESFFFRWLRICIHTEVYQQIDLSSQPYWLKVSGDNSEALDRVAARNKAASNDMSLTAMECLSTCIRDGFSSLCLRLQLPQLCQAVLQRGCSSLHTSYTASSSLVSGNLIIRRCHSPGFFLHPECTETEQTFGREFVVIFQGFSLRGKWDVSFGRTLLTRVNKCSKIVLVMNW